ncbi:MAG: threonine synthase [Bacillota bacterium]
MDTRTQKFPAWPGVVERYRPFLPLDGLARVVTLREGNTPLVEAPRLGAALGIRLYLKLEGCNPTGSFKDRGMTVVMTGALGRGAQAVICASTGNTSASAAAYAARAGLPCFVIVPGGQVARGKLAQALMHGARLVPVEGNFDQGLAAVRALAGEHPEVELVNSVNPLRLEGQKTAAFELADQLGDVPDVLALPVGNAGNISAYWRGFRQYREAGLTGRLPVLLGVQAAGAAPLAEGRPFPKPETVATAIRIGSPASGHLALQAVAESQGSLVSVSDDEILEASRLLARSEGVFAEPASAASLAGVRKQARSGLLDPGATVVCVLTGHGLKDPETALAETDGPAPVRPEVPALARALGL